MPSKFRTAILGLGGVGGYIGGKLAGRHADSQEIEVDFVARGAHADAIAENGLKLMSSDGEQIVRPSIITSDPKQLGAVDLIICCVKSYDLESSIAPFASCVGSGTVILPLLNGVDATERISRVLPSAEVWDGCIYLLSRLIAPGVVKETGSVGLLYFGSNHAKSAQLQQVEAIMKSAGINAHLASDIDYRMWEKFIFISPVATLTSYLNLPLGEIRTDPKHREVALSLLNELNAVADAKAIALPADIIESTLDRIDKLPFDATSSMHSDFQRGARTELESLTGYVVRQGEQLDVSTPQYDRIYSSLLRKTV